MKRRILSALICTAMMLSLVILPTTVSAASFDAKFDFQDQTVGASVLGTAAAPVEFTDNGTKLQIYRSDGTDVLNPTGVIANSDSDIMTSNLSGNKFVKLDYIGGAGKDVGVFKVIPASPIKEDFSFEFDFAIQDNLLHSWETMMDIMIVPETGNGDMGKWTKPIIMNRNYSIRVRNEDVYPTSPYWSYYSGSFRSIDYSQASKAQFATMKINVYFHDGARPTFDVLVRFPGETSFAHTALNGQFNTNVSADDYNNNGIKYVKLDIATGDGTDSTTVFDAAVDRVKLYKYTAASTGVDFDFEDLDMGINPLGTASSPVNTFDANGNLLQIYRSGTSDAMNSVALVTNTDSDIVTANPSGNKLVTVSYIGGVDTDAGKFQVTPISPLKSDFSFQYDFAMKDNQTDYSWSIMMDVMLIPETGNGDMGKWTKPLIMTKNYAIRVPNSDVAPTSPYWSFYSYNYSTVASYNPATNQFATAKVDVHFHDGARPTYDVSVKLPGEKYFAHTLTGRQFNTNVSADDYNNNGIKRILVDFGAGADSSAASAYNVSLDNIKIYDYSPYPDFGTLTFDDGTVDSIARAYDANTSATVNYSDGTTLTSAAGVSRLTVTDSGFVTNNAAGNKYLEIYFEGNDTTTSTANLMFNFPEAFKEDFTVQFKYAADTNYPVYGTSGYWDNLPTLMVTSHPKGRTDGWQFYSRIFYVLGKYTYGRPAPGAEKTTYNNGSSLSVKNVGLGQFETIRLETKFHESSAPTVDAYRKRAGADSWECLAKDIQYSTKAYNNTVLDASFYNTDGIDAIGLEFKANGDQAALSGSHYMKVALDDIQIAKTNKDKIEFLNVGIKDSADNSIGAGASINGKTLYPDISAANYYELNKYITVLMATYDEDGAMTGMQVDRKMLDGGEVTNINSSSFDGIAVPKEGYARLYIMEGLDSMNQVTKTFTTER